MRSSYLVTVLFLALSTGCSPDAELLEADATPTTLPDAGAADATPPALPDAGAADATPRRLKVFLTRETYAGDLAPSHAATGAARADELCRSAASAAGLAGSFLAFVPPDARTTPVLRIVDVSDGPWYRTDGELAFPARMGNGPVVALDRDEYGAQVVAGDRNFVWTGVNGPLVADRCRDFTVAAFDVYGIVGDFADTSGGKWETALKALCQSRAHLYCFEI